MTDFGAMIIVQIAAKRDIDAKELAEDVTLKVEILRFDGWKLRLWLALQLIKFAAWIAWINVEFTDE